MHFYIKFLKQHIFYNALNEICIHVNEREKLELIMLFIFLHMQTIIETLEDKLNKIRAVTTLKLGPNDIKWHTFPILCWKIANCIIFLFSSQTSFPKQYSERESKSKRKYQLCSFHLKGLQSSSVSKMSIIFPIHRAPGLCPKRDVTALKIIWSVFINNIQWYRTDSCTPFQEIERNVFWNATYFHFYEKCSFWLTWAEISSELLWSPVIHPSVCKFSPCLSSPEPLGQFQSNLVESIFGWNELKFVQMKGHIPEPQKTHSFLKKERFFPFFFVNVMVCFVFSGEWCGPQASSLFKHGI